MIIKIIFLFTAILCLSVLFYDNVENFVPNFKTNQNFSPVLQPQNPIEYEPRKVPRNWLEEDPMDYTLRNHYWQTGERRPLFATKNYE